MPERPITATTAGFHGRSSHPFDLTHTANLDHLRTSFRGAYDAVVPEIYQRCAYLGWPMAAWLIRRGSVRVRSGGHRAVGRAGQWLFPAAADGWQEFEPGTAILSVRFSARWLDRRSLFDHSKPRVLDSAEHSVLEAAGVALVRAIDANVGRVKRELWATPTALDTHFIVQQHFQGWLTAYVRAMRSEDMEPYMMDETDARLLEAMHFIEGFPLTKTLHEPDVAKAAGLSVSHLNRLFASEYGTTPKRYFDVRRQEFASNALLFTPMQVKSIAYKLGFSSLPHFTKWFHRHTGRTPTAYRRAGQAGE